MSPIVSSLRKLQQNFLNRSLHPVRKLLPDSFIHAAARDCGMSWRRRLFDPVVTLLACIFGHLDGVRSVREIDDWINGFDADVRRDSSGSSFCDARKRLPLGLFARCGRQIADAASEAAGVVKFGLRVLSADGTSLRTGRTKANIAHFGRHANQHGVSKRPVVRLMLVCCAGTGAVVSWLAAPFAWAERRLLYRMLRGIGPGCLLMGDAGLFSYVMLSRLVRFGSHGLFRLPAWKTVSVERRRLGPGDRLELWKRPRPVHSLFPKLLRREPDHLRVRVITVILRRNGYRDVKLRLVTTLLDPKACPVSEIVELYRHRWAIELDIRDLKSRHLPAVQGGRTPDAVLREVASGVLAFSLVRAMAAEGCAEDGTGNEVRRVSHKRSCNVIAEMASRMREAPAVCLPRLYRQMLKLLSGLKQKSQDRPPEPRAIVRLPRRYPILTKTRDNWRQEYAA